MSKRTFLTIGLLAVLAGFVSLFMLISQFTDGAVQSALRENNTPDTAQRVTAVCVGLNIGSCRTTQESTTGIAGDGNPWGMIALATAVIAPLVLWGAFYFSKPRDWED